jgi:hypothetical protein
MYVSDWLVEDESDDAESDAENQRNLSLTDLPVYIGTVPVWECEGEQRVRVD